jgi:hypothetical protein
MNTHRGLLQESHVSTSVYILLSASMSNVAKCVIKRCGQTVTLRELPDESVNSYLLCLRFPETKKWFFEVRERRSESTDSVRFFFPAKPGTKKMINAETFHLFTVGWLSATPIGFILTLCWPQINCTRNNIPDYARTVVDWFIDTLRKSQFHGIEFIQSRLGGSRADP